MDLGSLLFGSPGMSKSAMIRETTKPPLTKGNIISRSFDYEILRAMFMQDSEKGRFERLPDGFDVLDPGAFDVALRKLELEDRLWVGRINPAGQRPKLTSTRRTDQPAGPQTWHPQLAHVPALVPFSTYNPQYRATRQYNTIYRKHSFSQNSSEGDQVMLYSAFERTYRKKTPQSKQVIVKSIWMTWGGQPGRDYRLVELEPGQTATGLRAEVLEHLKGQDGYTDCFVDVYDLDKIPPGAIPQDAEIRF
jgi:hypothetical protein